MAFLKDLYDLPDVGQFVYMGGPEESDDDGEWFSDTFKTLSSRLLRVFSLVFFHVCNGGFLSDTKSLEQ